MNRLFFILTFVIISCGNLYAQSADRVTSTYVSRKYKKAVAAFRDRDYNSSLKYIHQAQTRDPEFKDLYILKYRIYKVEKDTLNQISCLNTLIEISPTFSPNSFYLLAELYFSLSRYGDALNSYQNFIKYVNSDNRKYDDAVWAIRNCLFALESIDSSNGFDVASVVAVNTKYNDYWPYVNVFSHELYFTRMNESCMDEDIMVSSMNDSTSVSLPFNTPFNEGTSSVTADGRYHFFSSNNLNSNGSHDIFFVERTADGWGEPINLGEPVNSAYWESQTSISADGKMLFFASNRPGGNGGSDLYVSKLLKWTDRGMPVFSVPVNLNINTADDDMAPYIYADSKTLYFSTKGRPGMGGFDIFKSTIVGNVFSDPVNLAYPINSNKDELGFTLSEDGSLAYFCSERNGDMDIFSCKLKQDFKHESIVNRFGYVTDDGGSAVCASLIITNNLDDSIVETRVDGLVSLFLKAGLNYLISVMSPGCMMYYEELCLQDSVKSCRINKDIVLRKICVGDKIKLNSVSFDFDSSVLKKSSYKELLLWVEYLKVNKTVCVEIGGHTDSIGNSTYNMELSIRRAKVIYDFIIINGISKDRLVYKGYGDSLPVLSNESKFDYSNDRRTEMKILLK